MLKNNIDKYCYDCGQKLSEVRVFDFRYATFYRCMRCRETFLNVSDLHNLYNLFKIHDRRAQRVLEFADLDILKNHFGKLEPIDQYTVKTFEFEEDLISLYHKHKDKYDTIV